MTDTKVLTVGTPPQVQIKTDGSPKVQITGDVCPDCSSTPSVVRVTFSSVNICAGCGFCETEPSYSWELSLNFDINDVEGFDLGYYGGDSCIWVSWIANGVTVKKYSDGACENLVSEINHDVKIQLAIIAGEYILSVTYYDGAAEMGCFFVSYYIPTSGCVNIASAANDLTYCGNCLIDCSIYGGGDGLGYDGTAKVEEL